MNAGPYITPKRDAGQAETRRKILSAARELFARRGYEQTGIRDIAGAIQMSVGAVFANFRGKADVFREVYGFAPPDPTTGARALELLKSHAEVFRHYAAIHTEKRTPEGDQKAEANRLHAEEAETLLRVAGVIRD